MSTSYFNGEIGKTHYLKKLPLTLSPWSTGVVAAVENGTTGEFSATTNDSYEYWALEQLGGSPAESDTDQGPIALIPANPQYADLGTAIFQSRVNGTSLSLYVGETISISIEAVDVNGNEISLVGKTLSIIFELIYDVAEQVIVSSLDITIDTATATFDMPAAVTTSPSLWRWVMRDDADGKVIMQGMCNVANAPVALV